jgi:iron(III) transport system ATP-binding protein
MSAPGARPPRLVLDRVSYRYGARTVVDAVSLDVGPGELVCMLGPSGCGKTTTLRIAAGLEPPMGGRVVLDGRPVAGDGAWLPPEARKMGYLFQDYALFPHLTVMENVAFGLDGLPSRDRAGRARAMLAQVGMGDYADAWPHQLSGGQQQRVALARALAPQPTVMLLDEPFSGLDRSLADQVRQDTLRLLRETGVATLMVTHDPEEAMSMADRIAVMRAGRVIQSGSPKELYDRPADPFVAGLFSQVNVLRGVVRDHMVATALGRFAAPGMGEGTAALVLVRPEALRPESDPAGSLRLESSRLLGPYLELRLSLGPSGPDGVAAETVIARLRRGPLPEVGQPMTSRVDGEGVFVFPDAGSDVPS